MRVMKPWQLARAQFIDMLCQRYGCLPSALLREDAGELLQIQQLLAIAEGKAETVAEMPKEMDEEEMMGLTMVPLSRNG